MPIGWQAIPRAKGSENTLVLGELNAYSQEDALDVLAYTRFIDRAAAELGNDALLGGVVGVINPAPFDGESPARNCCHDPVNATTRTILVTETI